ncbi:MAG: SIMPL domain-containing protein [Patescibacteria group bacterium]|nr:SIMPL domain-containing protein [Patescibacteria group bacterium]
MGQDSQIVKIEPPQWMMGVATVVALFLLAFLVALTRNAWKANTYIGRTNEAPHVITISGDGKVTAIPDIAVVSLGTQTEKKNVADAQAENTRSMNALRDRIKSLQIAAEDITTSQYSVYPQYDWNTGKQTLRGYQVVSQVTVKIRDFDKISPVLALVGELNLNQVGGLSFTIDDPETYRQQARLKALAQAKAKAEALAQAAGVALGRIVSFAESGSGNVPQPYYARDAYGMGGGATAVPAPVVEPGSQDITVSVTVGYELQ